MRRRDFTTTIDPGLLARAKVLSAVSGEPVARLMDAGLECILQQKIDALPPQRREALDALLRAEAVAA